MVKKVYVPPIVIDLSIEGVTGIGGSLCDTGPSFSDSDCGDGGGYVNTCHVGGWASSSCNDGTSPNYNAVVCNATGSDAAGACWVNGANASGAFSECFSGNSPSLYCGSGSSVKYSQTNGTCNNGSGAGFCNNNGSTQQPFISSS
ncbi:hypothetical protein [Methanospirillum lacunae]|uniref:Uncharacterized protein n=1 Tax=Methanospirillum lacunae TaxID=668570 RepID=A0A2V2MZ51_9EURY|nr:hypothetical protein [Methanospirillum lacunae]PWR73222.1 hypothetical protein DK846_05190 [Methanospirillum lacunae]